MTNVGRFAIAALIIAVAVVAGVLAHPLFLLILLLLIAVLFL